jgi:hypothetical protein
MKKLLFLLLVLPSMAFAQDNKPIGNFYITRGRVVYSHVFNDSLDSAATIVKKLIPSIPFSSYMKNVDGNGYTITGHIDEADDSPGALIPQQVEEKGYFMIEVKNGKYRVTVKNLFFISPQNVSSFEYLYLEYHKTSQWTGKAHNELGDFDKGLTTLFTVNPGAVNSDW